MARLIDGAPLRLKINLYILYALPHLLMLPIFVTNAKNRKRDQLDSFEKLFRHTAKNWLGVKYSFPNEALYTIFGTEPMRMINWASKFDLSGRKDHLHIV